MITDFLAQLLDNTIRARVFRLFFNAEEDAFSLEDITKRTQTKNAKSVAKELERLSRMGIIRTYTEKVAIAESQTRARRKKPMRRKVWSLNQSCPHLGALRALTFATGLRADAEPMLLEKLRRVGRLRLVIMSSTFMSARSGDAKIDLLLVGDSFDGKKMDAVLASIESERGREIRYAAFSPREYAYRLDVQDRLIRDLLDYPHQVLLDKLA